MNHSLTKRFEVVDKYRVSNCMVLKAGFTAWNALLAYVLGRQDLIDGHQTYMYVKTLLKTMTVLEEEKRQVCKG